MKPGVRDFHAFILRDFKKYILEGYEQFHVLSEGDLQALAWSLLLKFFQESDPTKRRFRVLNKPYFKDLRIHPDIAVFKRRKPWILLELKERRKMAERTARREWKRLIRARRLLNPKPKRAYFIYVARYGSGKVLTGPKGPGAKYFFEVPIILENNWTRERVREWEGRFKKWSKYTAKAPSND